jgi:uncharacterized protein YhjY with autotransporter beta-barrel domain
VLKSNVLGRIANLELAKSEVASFPESQTTDTQLAPIELPSEAA